MYKCDTHVHTAESSACGKVPAEDIVTLYKEAGYSTIFITDHFDYRYIDTHSDNFKEQYEKFCAGFRLAKQKGDEIGLTVLFATEIMLKENLNHYLLYNVDDKFLTSREDIFDMTIKELHEYAKENGVFIVQAHPYRDGKNLPSPEHVDAIEVYNSHPRHANFNEEALEMAIKFDKLQTAGSDAHQLPDIALSGVITDTKIESAQDYINAVKNKKITLIR